MSSSNLLSGRSPAFDVSGGVAVRTAWGVADREICSDGAGIDATDTSSTFAGSSVCGLVDAGDELLGTSFSTLVSVFIIASQSHAIFFGHSGMSVALGGFDPALISIACFISLTCSLISAGQHA